MKFYNYINEAKVKFTGDFQKDKLLKELQQWDSDVRKMTKLYKSLKAEDTPRAIKEFKETKQYFTTFQQNFEKWVYRYLISTDTGKKGESYLQQVVREKAWKFNTELFSSSLFPDTYDPNLKKHVPAPWDLDLKDNRRLNIQRYQMAWREAFKSIHEYIEHEGDKFERMESLEQFSRGGVNIKVINYGRVPDSFTEGEFKKLINQLNTTINNIENKGFKGVFKDLTVTINFYNEHGDLKGGHYNKENDELLILPLGVQIDTFVHEMGHRVWYKYLPPNARKSWKKIIDGRVVTVTRKNIDNFLSIFLFDDNKQKVNISRKEIKNKIKNYDTDPTTKTVYIELSGRIPAFTDKFEEIRDFYYKNLENEKVNLEFISDYGATNSTEAFAEAFKLYILKGPRSLGEWTKEFFKDIVSAGGFKLTENFSVKKEGDNGEIL